ncbi:MAG: hypothetical protein ACI8RZ_003256 [Myxococcota bacterium]|jgi:hypothetical protein
MIPQDPLPPSPPTLQEALTDQARGHAETAARRKAWSALYRVVPSVLHPLIPGHSRTFGDNLEKEASRRVSKFVGGCLFSLFFFAVVVGVLAVFAAIIAWSLFTA